MDINNIDYRIQQNQETPLPHLHDQEMNLKTKENMLYEYQYEKSILNSKELIDINEKIKNLKDELIRHKNLFKEESNILGNIISLMEERNSILMKNAEYLKSIIESYKDGTKESSNLINNSVSYLNNAEVNEEKIKLTETQEKLKVQTICCDGNQTFPDKWQMLENKINNPSNQTSESCSVVCNFSVNVGTQKQTTDAPKINEIESFIPKTNAQRQKEFRERKKLSRQGARTAYNRTMETQPDKPEDVTNEPLPSMEVQGTVAIILATPFAQPLIAASKSKAQKQREYRQRIAASRTPAQAAAARKSKNERQRKNRLRQAANLTIASGSLEATTTSSSRSGEESNNVQTRSQRQHVQQQSTTTADQLDECVNLTNKPLFPAIPVPATPFAKPITAAPKTRAQIQREYRQRIAISRTPAQAAAARKSKNERQRKNRLRQAANLAIASGYLEATFTS